jgi:hypothetical protein
MALTRTETEALDRQYEQGGELQDYTPLPGVCCDCGHEGEEYKKWCGQELFYGYFCHHPVLKTSIKAQDQIRRARRCSLFVREALAR